MSYTVKTTEADPEFIKAGQKNGTVIWRIENFKVKKMTPKQFGKFYTGDSYIILHTNLEERISNIHYWLGTDSSIDEYGTAALKAVELDDYLGGKPIQHREVQNHESKAFLSLFEDSGLRYLSGGCPSGFNDSKETEEETKLYMVKGKRDVRIAQVPLSIESLNKSDVFILDNNETVYQWNPPGSNRMEQLKGSIFAKRIRDDDHSGKSEVVVIDSDEWRQNRDFWSFLPGDKDDIKEQSDVCDREFEKSFSSTEMSLYKVSDEESGEVSIELVQKGKLKRELLDPKDCFIVDSQSKGIFCWIGRNCTRKEKNATVAGSKNLMVQMNYPNYIPLETVIDGGETTVFKSLFFDWNNQL